MTALWEDAAAAADEAKADTIDAAVLALERLDGIFEAKSPITATIEQTHRELQTQAQAFRRRSAPRPAKVTP